MCLAETKGVLAASTRFCAAAKASQKRSATRGRHTKGRIVILRGGEQSVCARVRQVYDAYRQALVGCAGHMHVVGLFATTVLLNVICKSTKQNNNNQANKLNPPESKSVTTLLVQCMQLQFKFEHCIMGLILGNKVKQCKHT